MYYVADFETNTLTKEQEDLYKQGKISLKELKTHVWGWGLVKRGKHEDKDIIIGNTIDGFMNRIMKLRNPKILFHNLKFDGNFILSWLLKNGYTYTDKEKNIPNNSFKTLINDMGVFYSIEVYLYKKNKAYRKLTFHDSYKKLPFTVDRIGKAFDLQYNKIEMPEGFYQLQRDLVHELSENEIEYIKNDIRVMSLALEILAEQDMLKMTVGSDALNDYKKRIGEKAFEKYYPILENDVDSDIKQAYRGGVTMVKESVRNKEIGIGKTYDVNSMYPFAMRFKKMPYGYPLFFKGKYKQYQNYDLYIQEIECEFKIKKDHLPTIQIKGQPGRYSPREYLNESKGVTTLHLSNVDLDLFFEHYDVTNITYTKGYMFRSSTTLFNEYIDHWVHIKETSIGAMRELAKLMLNSLYGKFGTKTIITNKYPILDENNLVKLKIGKTSEIKPVYSATAVFTTAYGRDMLIRTAQANYDRFCYCDTDSIHVTGIEPLNNMKMDPNILGYWDDEGTFSRARFIGAKCYIEDFIETGLKVTCAGMSKAQHNQVTYENFKEGLVVTGKLQPKVVNGGVVLLPVDYAVKVRGFRF